MANFFSTAWARLQAETPSFFKKVRNIGKSLLAAGTAGIVPQMAANVATPPLLITLATHAIVVGTVMTLVASFACKDAPEVDPNQPKKP
jgi:hypothetical protein